MKRLLWLWLFFLFVSCAKAQNITAGGADCSVFARCVSVDTGNDDGAVAFSITGTFSATLQFEVRGPGSAGPWVALNVFPPDSDTAVTSTTTTGVWSANIGAMQSVRVRASAYASGTAVVVINTTRALAKVRGVGGGGGDAPADATYITQTADGTLSAEQAIGSLSTGIMRVLTGAGTITSLTDSAGLLANISDESGSGALLFGTSPTIETPTISGAVVFPDGVRQTFNPNATTPGLNIGSQAGDPSGPSNGDFWYNGSTHQYRVYRNATLGSLLTEADTVDFTTYADGSTVTAVSGAPVETPITDSNATGEALQFDVPTGAFSKITGLVQNTLTLTGGAGIAAIGDLSANRTVATASGEADFLASGALTCGAATQGKAQVHTTPLQYCDANAGTPALQYAAYGNSVGEGTAAANDSVALTTDTTGNYAAGDAEAGAALTGDALPSFFPAFTTAQLATELSDEDYEPGDAASVGAVTKTLTNTTFDAEATGNVFTHRPLVEYQAGVSQAGTAGASCSTPSANAPAATSVVGTNTIYAVDAFDQTTDESIQCRLWLPPDWTGAIDWSLYWRGVTGSTNSVIWAIQAICVADAETGDPAFNTASTITDAGKGTTAQFNLASATGITITGCTPNGIMFLKISRDADNASDTYADDAQLISFRVEMRRTEQ